MTTHHITRFAVGVAALALAIQPLVGQEKSGDQEGFRFRSGVELINVNATVTDRSGRFVPDLGRDDFRIFEDGEPQTITHFSNERVPVSLGIAVDTSGSMAGEKMEAAKQALDRFLFDLLGPEDEVFLYRFGSHPDLVQEWTTNRETVSRELRRIRPSGGTAMYDTVAEAVQLAQTGKHTKKALLIISDGNDTNSGTDERAVRQLIRETEVLVYAIGIDGRGESTLTRGQPRVPIPFPIPIPGRRGPFPWPNGPTGRGGGGVRGGIATDDRVNIMALRELTDDSGGRTEIVRSARDLDPATTSVAHELSQQYYLGYPAKGTRDGRWHAIRVEVRANNYTVRARRGYVAS